MRGLIALTATAVALLTGTAAASATPLPVELSFQGSGTFDATNGAKTSGPTHAVDALSWDVSYKGSLENDTLSFEPGAVPASAGSYQFTDDGIFKGSCTGTIPPAPGAAAPKAVASDGKLQVQSITSVDQNDATHSFDGCTGTSTGGTTQNNGEEAASTVGAIEPYLPGVLTAQVDLPPIKTLIQDGTFTKSVSESDAAVQLPDSCASEFGWSDPGQCVMSTSWTGTIKLQIPCGQISFSEGSAPPVGTLVNKGQTVSAGPGSRAEITFADGSVIRIGPKSSLEIADCQFSPNTDISVKDVLGSVWAAISGALGGSDSFEVSADRAVVGVRGGQVSFLVSRDKILYHVIEGTGFVRVPGKKEFDFPAGEGVEVGPKGYAYGYKLTTAWPVSARALVPAAALPPKISALKASGKAGGKPTVTFKLSEAAKVTVRVLKGKRRIASMTASARKGANKLGLRKRLAKGLYSVQLTAVRQGRTSVLSARLRAR
jgi:hypothetical protein